MVSRERMVSEFMELVRIDSLSRQEREMADVLKSRLKALGLDVCEDDTGKKIGGNAGNLICTIEGEKDVPGIIFLAHMDTVVPGKGKKPVQDGDIVRSDGTTILGGDDAVGIEAILEAVRVIKENNIKHGDIEVVFTVSEERGLSGSRNLDYSKIKAQYGFVVDSSMRFGNIVVKSPSQCRITASLYGKAAHAGIDPERGVSAVQIAAKAISQMRLGRIDGETTANIGIIHGGLATNIVCDRVDLRAEVRSRNPEKLEAQVKHMTGCFEQAAAKFNGRADIKIEHNYPLFHISENDDIIKVVRKAMAEVGSELILAETGGGSDANILNSKGIPTVNISMGTQKVHSLSEFIYIDDMVKTAELLVAIAKNVE